MIIGRNKVKHSPSAIVLNVSFSVPVICTAYQIGMVIWLSGEDAPSNICTVLIVHHCNEEFRLFATVAMCCDNFDACIMTVLEDEVITTQLA